MLRMDRREFALGSGALLLAGEASAERNTREAGKNTRSPVLATHGMVASAHPLATQIGLDILKRGGNAVDAAIGVNAALGLMEPMSCGIGGDLMALVYDAKSRKVYGLNASGRSPYAASMESYRARGLAAVPTSGPLSWSVPGCVDGWRELLSRFGSRPLREILAPTIAYAREGTPVPEVISGYWRGAQRVLSRDEDAARTYLPGGRSPKAGEVFRNPELAATYETLAKEGPEAFYRGRIAEALVEMSGKKGGLFVRKDFEDHTSTWDDAASTRYRSCDVWALPPPTQGIATLQILNLLDGYDLSALGANSPEFWHLFVEAKKLAYADRARYYTDPRFVGVPVKQLVSKEYAARRRRLIQQDRAMVGVPSGDARLQKTDTTYLCVVDKNRNCVSLIQSNYNGFGSGLAAGRLGFAMQNRGALFALDPRHANRLEPHRRPFHTIIPGMATRDGKPWLTFGVMGGDMQPQGQAQVLINMLDFGMDIQAAGDAPRIEHRGSASPRAEPEQARGGTVILENGIPASVASDLTRRGHVLQRTATNGGGYQAIMIDPGSGVLSGGTESRKDGCAAGY